MTAPRFSIIMPVYNGAETLGLALESVLFQSFMDFELIAVDDGSTDDTQLILSRAAQMDARVRVVALETNGGLSAARNAGMDAARGAYWLFMDADDVVDESLLSELDGALSRCPADMYVFGVLEEYRNAHEQTVRTNVILPREAHIVDRAALILEAAALEEKTLFGYAWNKAYAAHIIKANDLRFACEVLIEDFLFNADFLSAAQSMATLPIAPYTYRIRSGENLTARFESGYYAVHRRRIGRMHQMLAAESLLDAGTMAMLANRYARYIISAVARTYEPDAQMAARERRAFFGSIFADDLYCALRPYMSGVSGTLVRARSRFLLSSFSRVSQFLKCHLPSLFVKIKKYAR